MSEQRYSKPALINLLTLIVMGFSAIGVLLSTPHVDRYDH